jgi:hypothetical protein
MRAAHRGGRAAGGFLRRRRFPPRGLPYDRSCRTDPRSRGQRLGAIFRGPPRQRANLPLGRRRCRALRGVWRNGGCPRSGESRCSATVEPTCWRSAARPRSGEFRCAATVEPTCWRSAARPRSGESRCSAAAATTRRCRCALHGPCHSAACPRSGEFRCAAAAATTRRCRRALHGLWHSAARPRSGESRGGAAGAPTRWRCRALHPGQSRRDAATAG